MGSSSSKISLTDLQQYKLKYEKREAICKIRINQKDKGYGFLCMTPKSKTKLLITDSHTLKENDFEDNKSIEMILYNNIIINISCSDDRTIYMDKKNDIIIIEIKDDHQLKTDFFLEFDDNIDINNPNSYYKNKSICILKDNLTDQTIHLGYIILINHKNFILEHNCDIEIEPFSYPILFLQSLKIIGFNKSKNNGIFLKDLLDEFDKKLNEIKKIKIIKEEEEKRKEKEKGKKKKK